MGNRLRIENIIPDHVESLSLKLNEIGIPLEIGSDYVVVSKSDNMKRVNIKTQGYPGFPTDLQQPLTTLLTQCKGKSILEETIYENRFQNVEYLNRMGSKIEINDKKIYIEGPTALIGTDVTATDLRAGACLVLAALIAQGTTTINEVKYILRGYENIVEKLQKVGAKISLKEV